LLEYAPKRGYRVRDFGLKEILDAYKVRAALEGLACVEAARIGLDERQVAILTDALATGDRILSKGVLDPADLEEYRLMNHTFHETIVGVSTNRWIAEFVHAAHNVPMASDRLILWDDFGIIHRSHDDHHRILEALLDRDAGRAEGLMREHVFYAGEILKARIATGKGIALSAGRNELASTPSP
jgi:GntR family transcriptional regulator of vanillate catabolism